MDGKGYIYLENQGFSTLKLSHSTITQTSCNFSPLLMFEFGSIRRCLASLENPALNDVQSAKLTLNLNPLLFLRNAQPRVIIQGEMEVNGTVDHSEY